MSNVQEYSEEQIDYGMEEDEDYYEQEEGTDDPNAEDMIKRMAEMDEELKETENNGQKVTEQLATIADQIDEKSMYVLGQFIYIINHASHNSLRQICWASRL
jgi:hypothetical protein